MKAVKSLTTSTASVTIPEPAQVTAISPLAFAAQALRFDQAERRALTARADAPCPQRRQIIKAALAVLGGMALLAGGGRQ